MLELHVWGPAFGLPSIDAECLATIIYFQNILPSGSWTLVASNNPNLNPFRRLPALHDDANNGNPDWVAGYEDIRKYISANSAGEWDMDRDLDGVQQADSTAYTSFLYAKGLPLLDLTLYISSDNYTASTRSAWGDLLSWPQSWIVPHELRKQAKRRSEHLGLSGLDVDAAQQDDDGDDAGLTAKIPKSLRKPKQTVSGLLGRGVQKTRFRLDAVTEDFLEPLQTKLQGREWLAAPHMCGVDCLAIAILSLMQLPNLPQAWLRDALTGKYSSLGEWNKSHAGSLVGSTIGNNALQSGDKAGETLPWVDARVPSMLERSMQALETVVGNLPLIRYGYDQYELSVATEDSANGFRRKQMAYTKLRHRQQLYSQIITACIGTTSVLGWMVHAGILALPFVSAKPTKRDFGAAGALLGL